MKYLFITHFRFFEAFSLYLFLYIYINSYMAQAAPRIFCNTHINICIGIEDYLSKSIDSTCIAAARIDIVFEGILKLFGMFL